MAYIGIGYSGNDPRFLRDQAGKHAKWLKGDRTPRFFGDHFIVMYDANTAREFAQKCKQAAEPDTITIYPMNRPYEQ